MLAADQMIVRFVAAVIVAALFSGCTINVYLTDQVIYGTVTQAAAGQHHER